MKRIAAFLCAVALPIGSATGAAAQGIQLDMQGITQHCLTYTETGQVAGNLMSIGFSQRGKKFRKSYNRSAIGGTKPVISVDRYVSNVGPTCVANFSILAPNDSQSMITMAKSSTRAAGYTEVAVKDSRGRQFTGFQKGSSLIRVGGSSKRGGGNYSASIYFEKLQ